MKTTLNKIRAHGPCRDGWGKLLKHLDKTQADDDPLLIETILDSNGVEDATWCLRAVEGHNREIRLFAVWCARQVKHLMTDERSHNALTVAERYANGLASDDELSAADSAAWSAARSAARSAAWSAAWDAAGDAARDAAQCAAQRAARSAAEHTAGCAAWSAAWDAAGDAARDAAQCAAQRAARSAQSAELRRVCRAIEAGEDPYLSGARA